MDFGQAFSYVFDDDEWVKKVLIGGLISIIPLIGSFVVYGYMIEVARRVFDTPQTAELPEWDDFGGYLSSGLLFWLGLVVWALPFILLFVCGMLLMILLGVAVGGETVVGVSFVFFYLVLMPAMLIFSLAAGLAIPILLGRFAIHRRFGSMFEFGEIVEELRRIGPVPLLLIVVIYLVAGSLGQMGIFLCFIGAIFTSFYGNLAIGHAAGQTYRLARGMQQPEVPATKPVGY